MTREWPIIFGAESVRAILAGAKSQTRRIVGIGNSSVDGSRDRRDHWRLLDFDRAWVDRGPSPAGNPGPYLKVSCKDDPAWQHDGAIHRVYPWVFGGEGLWVRETFIIGYEDGRDGYSVIPWSGSTERDGKAFYRATFTDPDPDEGGRLPWRSPIHMPRWASRILLRVEGVRVERLQDISEEDALAEGIDDGWLVKHHVAPPRRQAFALAWDDLNGDRAPWASNAWVWVVSFSRVDAGELARSGGACR